MKIDILKIGLDPVLQFEAVGRLKSLKQAAGELGLSQPAITHALNKLEGSLGVQLCLRSRTQFVMTEAGKRLFALSQEIKVGLRNYQGFLENNESFNGFFSIGLLDNVQCANFELTLQKTIRAFPSMRLNIQAYTASDIQNLVSVGEMDVGLGIFNKKLSHLSYAKIGEETICHYISEAHALWNKRDIKESDIRAHSIAWVDIVSRNKLALDAEIFLDNKRGLKNVGSYTNNLHIAKMLLRTGARIVPLPREYLDSENVDFKYRRLDSVFKPYALKLEIVSRRDFANASPVMKFFLAEIGRYL